MSPAQHHPDRSGSHTKYDVPLLPVRNKLCWIRMAMALLFSRSRMDRRGFWLEEPKCWPVWRYRLCLLPKLTKLPSAEVTFSFMTSLFLPTPSLYSCTYHGVCITTCHNKRVRLQLNLRTLHWISIWSSPCLDSVNLSHTNHFYPRLFFRAGS